MAATYRTPQGPMHTLYAGVMWGGETPRKYSQKQESGGSIPYVTVVLFVFIYSHMHQSLNLPNSLALKSLNNNRGLPHKALLSNGPNKAMVSRLLFCLYLH